MATGDERPHKKLEVWQRFMMLVKEVYDLTKEFPKMKFMGYQARCKKCSFNTRQYCGRSSKESKAEFLQF